MIRHPTILIILHWLLAPLVLLALYMGNDIAQLSNDLDLKVDRLIVHMSAGLVIGSLFVFRLIMKLNARKVTSKTTENKHMEKVAKIVHQSMYLLIFGVVISGIGIALNVDMLNIIKTEDTMPLNLSSLPIRSIHEVLTNLLLATIALHIVAAIYHQFILRDRLLTRMWFGKGN